MNRPDEVQPKYRLILEDDDPLLELLHSLFIGARAPFDIDDLADKLGISSHSLYKPFEHSERPLRADILIAAIQYTYRKGRNTEILDSILLPLGLEARPRMRPKVQRFVKNIESQLLELFPDSDAETK
jgi:hypothetical protein